MYNVNQENSLHAEREHNVLSAELNMKKLKGMPEKIEYRLAGLNSVFRYYARNRYSRVSIELFIMLNNEALYRKKKEIC